MRNFIEDKHCIWYNKTKRGLNDGKTRESIQGAVCEFSNVTALQIRIEQA